MTAEQLMENIAQYQAEIAQLQDTDLIDEDNFATKMHIANLEYWLAQDQEKLAELEA